MCGGGEEGVVRVGGICAIGLRGMDASVYSRDRVSRRNEYD